MRHPEHARKDILKWCNEALKEKKGLLINCCNIHASLKYIHLIHLTELFPLIDILEKAADFFGKDDIEDLKLALNFRNKENLSQKIIQFENENIDAFLDCVLLIFQLVQDRSFLSQTDMYKKFNVE